MFYVYIYIYIHKFPGSFEARNLSRVNLSRETGHKMSNDEVAHIQLDAQGGNNIINHTIVKRKTEAYGNISLLVLLLLLLL